jgi:hypothetical protein
MSIPLIIRAPNGRSTVYHAAELRREVQSAARAWYKCYGRGKVRATHVEIGEGGSVSLCLHMVRADGMGEVYRVAL